MGTLGDRLKEERKRLGFSQEEFAAIAGVTRRPYAEWEAGNTSPTGVQLAALYNEGADVQYIVTGVRSDAALSPDERELLALFRAAPLTVKAAAIGALQAGGAPPGSVQASPARKITKQINVSAPGGEAAGRDIVNKGRKG